MEHCHPASERIANKSASAFAKKYSSILGIVILVLPKCPLCIAAYSGTVAICGIAPLVTHHQNPAEWSNYLVILISAIITACVLFTYRARTYYILTMAAALCGLLLVGIGSRPDSWGLLRTDYPSVCYYTGATLLAAAVFFYSGTGDKLLKILRLRSFAIRK